MQHKQECKGLIVQIRYLKAKFTRESTLRDDLSYQKQYLLVLLASFEARYGYSSSQSPPPDVAALSDKRILACISRIGYPKPCPPAVAKKRRTFKSAAWCIVFIRRTRYILAVLLFAASHSSSGLQAMLGEKPAPISKPLQTPCKRFVVVERRFSTGDNCCIVFMPSVCMHALGLLSVSCHIV